MTTLASVAYWHSRARPSPTEENFNVQLGCHIEEISEMLEAMTSDDPDIEDCIKDAATYLALWSMVLKTGEGTVKIKDRKAFLDSLADQIVTATGVGHCAKMDVVKAVGRVDVSNWSKFDEKGQPIFDDNGKITKGPNYLPPTLEGLY